MLGLSLSKTRRKLIIEPVGLMMLARNWLTILSRISESQRQLSFIKNKEEKLSNLR